MMDLHKAPVDRSTTPGGIQDLSSPGESAKHFVKKDIVITISGGDQVGEVKYQFYLETHMDDALLSISKEYERWSIQDFKMYLQSGSPLGSASGGLQLCHIPDPENGNFDGQNIDKAVRQANSIFIKPRDSHTLVLDFDSSRYTKLAGSRRFSSFGSIACVVRSTPEFTDWATWNFTVEFTAFFYRPCIIDESITFLAGREVTDYTVDDDKLLIKLSTPLYSEEAVILFQKAYRLVIAEEKNGKVTTRPVRLTRLEVHTDDEGNLVYQYPEGLKIKKLITQMKDTLIIVEARGSMMECL